MSSLLLLPSLTSSSRRISFLKNVLQSLLIVFVLFGQLSFFYDGLGRRIQTKICDRDKDLSIANSEIKIIRYYYDPEVEFLELGHEGVNMGE